MTNRPRFATFDCYGTLIDWEGGLGSFLYDFSLRYGAVPPEDGDAMRRRWEAIQFEMIQGSYLPYKEILAASLAEWAQERDLPFYADDGAALVRAMRSWQPFHDARPALARAHAAGLQLAILSNTDRDIIAHSLKHLDLPFAAVVTAEDCGAYKPSRANFERLLAELDVLAGDIVHVAFGFKYDIGPAKEVGMRTAWVNRHMEPTPPNVAPDMIWRDLWGLPRLAENEGPAAP